ncbi:uncharacterized protein B0P05DRAFT_535839 [Gilbertella persicaria]|uniref:uncharacterized protein n=1 Tax=Gilbertella persicaria TaxID=101096 RepID=UPI002220B3A8|nr:uncharacterized protein B0P05DRAFT_535839 [Gilbertella persicaria]KAI8084012.1 hypothetical protein B0P05DRAFT_535839 [Gilbertella persicaria]
MTDDTDEPSGDELDDISARDIAMARYKRNHDYLSEIFTPYNAASIVPPSLELSQTKEELEKQIKEYKEKTQQQQDAYQKRLASLEKEQEQFWSKMNQLNQASTLDSINHVVAQLAQEMGVQIEHSTHNLKVVPIPGIEEHQPLQEQSQTQDHIMEETKSEPKSTQNNMDMYFEKDGEENNDSFFNEMVNTDDDPSVSEFLNTE